MESEIAQLKAAFLEKVKTEGMDLSQDPDFPYHLDDTYHRFLVARNNNVENALKMLW